MQPSDRNSSLATGNAAAKSSAMDSGLLGYGNCDEADCAYPGAAGWLILSPSGLENPA
jgi:hypothetical protein